MRARDPGAVVLLLLCAGRPGAAQSLTGSVGGRVTDEQWSFLPAATITLLGRTGASNTVNGADGSYRFPAVNPGRYELKVECSGFQTHKVEALSVAVGQQLTIDIALKLAGVEESLDVVGQASVVDVSSSSTSNGLSEDLLYNMPLSRFAVGLLNVTPGVDNYSAFGGAPSGNSMLLDGVDIRDPKTGTPYILINYNLVQEVQVQGLGATAEYGGFTGVVVNTITRSGGNRFAGLFDVQYTTQGLASNNVGSEVAAQNPGLTDPGSTRQLVDFTGQISGPIMKDKLFFFVNFQRYDLDTNPPGPRTDQHEVSPRLNAKLTWQPSAKDYLNVTIDRDAFNVKGVVVNPVSPLVATDDLTSTEESPDLVWSGQWRHILDSRTFLEAKYVGWSSRDDYRSNVRKPQHRDVNGRYSVSAGSDFYYDVGRQQANVAVSRYAEAFGKHELKFGLEIERGRARDRLSYVDNLFFVDHNGAPYGAYSYSYDVSSRNRRDSVYAQDGWKAGDRLTVNAGLRFDWIHGGEPDASPVFDTKSLAPRLGVAFDVAGNQRSVLKASYGQYYDAPFTAVFRSALSGVSDFVIYDNDGVSLAEFERDPFVPDHVDPALRQRRMDEWTLGFERALGPDVRLAFTGIRRENKNFINRLRPEARWSPVTLTNELTGEPITAYRWANRADSESIPAILANVDGFAYLDPGGRVIGIAHAYRSYAGLMAVLTRRFKGRWQAQVSYVLSRNDGTIENNTGNSIGPTHQFDSATPALVNGDGRLSLSRRHELKLLASYQVPMLETVISAYFHALSGRPYTPYQQLLADTLDVTPPAGRQVRLEPRGSRQLPGESILDLRIEKVFKLGSSRLGLYADIHNAFNAGSVTDVQTRVPSTAIAGVSTPVLFGAPLALVDARQIFLGARWSLN
jgi:hypothetical protein